jgi:hypothetical protein
MNGIPSQGNSTGGLVIDIAGDKNGLYAIALNSGVWKTEINTAMSFNRWRQLPQSPRYAHCIAVDPVLPDHLVVGEREGDGSTVAQNSSGLWESFDGGKTFAQTAYFDPLSIACRQGITSQVVNGAVITNQSTVIITTPCRIARKPLFASTFSHSVTTPTGDEFTAIAYFDPWIVARTRRSIFVSNDDGQTWSEHAIQFSFHGQQFTQPQREGLHSVAVLVNPVDGTPFVYLPATRTPNEKCLKGESTPTCNYGSYLVFHMTRQSWSFDHVTERGLGTGLGGMVFMKAFHSPNENLRNALGGRTNLIYCMAQNIFRAQRIDELGRVTWENIANADVGGEPEPSGFHSDIWDFHIDPLGWYAWVGTDGGVHYTVMPKDQKSIELNLNQSYLGLNEGLHTQHVHEGFVAGYTGNKMEEHYGYATQDNSGWWNATVNSIDNWQSNHLGDANKIRGDQGNRNVVIMYRHLQSASLHTFVTTPGVQPSPITIAYNGSNFQCIQTLQDEAIPPFLDVVMLTTLPITYNVNGMQVPVPGPLGSATGTVILRNRAFASGPDINLSQGSGWEIAFNDLPAGTEAFWVSGGHDNPAYFVLARVSGVLQLFYRRQNDPSWQTIALPAGVSLAEYNIDVVQNGPVWVNPYRTHEMYLVCSDGIYKGTIGIGGWIFNQETQLTNLLSDSGKYPLGQWFGGGNDAHVCKANQSELNAMYVLSSLAFNRFAPDEKVAASPYTGVFYQKGNGLWRNFSNVLPKPFTPVSSVNITPQGIYGTTEGRGIFKIVNY